MKSVLLLSLLLIFQNSFGQFDQNIEGSWRVDSTAEDVTFNVRPNEIEEYMVFSKDMSISMLNGSGSFDMGTYKIKGDTIQFISERGAVYVEWVATQIDSDHLRLDGVESIAGDRNPRKPTTFFTRKKENIHPENIYAQSQFGPIVYRGVQNKITLIVTTNEEYSIECQNCKSLTKTSNAQEYLVTPDLGKTLVFIAKSISDSTKLIASKRLEIKNLPDPIIYLDGTKNGRKIARSATEIKAKYPLEMHMINSDGQSLTCKMVRWRMQLGDQIFNGLGSEISEEASEALKNFKGEVIGITTVVRTPDGIARQIGCAFGL